MRSVKVAAYIVMTLLVSLTFFSSYYYMTNGHRTFWAYFCLFVAAIWASFPAYKSAVLRVATVTVTLLVMANLFLSPIVLESSGPPLLTLTPNVFAQIRIVGPMFPGIDGIQTITTNSAGHRVNRTIDYDHKDKNTLRIVAIGASTTHQAMLDDRKTWTDLLAGRLESHLGRPVEMINAAVSGTRLQDNFTAFKDSASYAPDVAIFTIGINDWNVHIKAANRPAAVKALSIFDGLTVSESILYRAIDTHVTWYLKTYISDLSNGRSNVNGAVRDEGGADWSLVDTVRRKPVGHVAIETVSANYAAWFGRISDECENRKILCLFVDQPTSYSPDIEPALLKLLWMTPPAADYTLDLAGLQKVASVYNTWLGRNAVGRHRAFCDAAAGMPPTTQYFTDDCHYNEGGARRMSEMIEQCLLMPGRLP